MSMKAIVLYVVETVKDGTILPRYIGVFNSPVEALAFRDGYIEGTSMRADVRAISPGTGNLVLNRDPVCTAPAGN